MTYVRADVDTKSIHREGDVLFCNSTDDSPAHFSFRVLPHTGRCRAAGRNPAGTFQQSNEINLLTNRTDHGPTLVYLSVKKSMERSPHSET